MSNKKSNETIEETEQTSYEPLNSCLDFNTVKMAVKYHEAMPKAIQNIVSLIDELEASGVGYVSTDEVKEALLKSFNEE